MIQTQKNGNLLDDINDKTEQSNKKTIKSINNDDVSVKKNKPKNEPKPKKPKKTKETKEDLEEFNKLKMFRCILNLDDNGKKTPILPKHWNNWNKINYYNLEELKEKKEDEKLYLNTPLKNLNGYCIPTGEINDIVVVDFDEVEQYNHLKKKFKLANTLTIKTKNGFHCYFKYDKDLKQTTGILGNIDIRNDGGFVIAPPTKYKNLSNTEEYEYKFKNYKKIKSIPPDFKELLLQNYNKKPVNKKPVNNKPVNNKPVNNKPKDKLECNISDKISEIIKKEKDVEVKFLMNLYNTLPEEVIDEYENWSKMIMSGINLNIDKEFLKLISWKFNYYNDITAHEKIDYCYNRDYPDDVKKCDENILKYWCYKYNKDIYFNICLDFQKFLELDFDIINDASLANLYITIFGENISVSSRSEGDDDKVYIYNEREIKNKNRRTEKRQEWFRDRDDGNNDNPLLKDSITKNLGDFFKLKETAEFKQILKLENRYSILKKKEELTEKEEEECLTLQYDIKNFTNKQKITRNCRISVGNQSTKTRLKKEILERYYCEKLKFDKYKIFDINDDEDYNIHYQDGYYNLKDKKYYQRVKDNLVSKTLKFNGNYEKEELIDEIKDWLEYWSKILPNIEDRLFYRKWLLYNLTGKTHYQQQLFNSGDGANGKTLLFWLFKKAFDIYVENLDKDVFASGNATRNKSIFKLYSNPIRCCFIEEIEGQKVDRSFFKEITGSQNGTIKCKQLYKQNEAEISVKSKFNFNFNELPDIDNDEATYRRLNEMIFTSKFCDNEEKLEEEKKKRELLNKEDENCPYKVENVYLKDFDITNKFTTERHKVALLYYLIYGGNGDEEISVDDEIDFTKYKKNYRTNTDDVDEFKLMFEEKYEFSDNSDDRLHKKNILDYFKKFKKSKTYNTDLIILKLMKQKYNKKFEYIKNLPLRKKDDGYEYYKGQGVYKFIKVKEDFQDDFGRNSYNFIDTNDDGC